MRLLSFAGLTLDPPAKGAFVGELGEGAAELVELVADDTGVSARAGRE